MEKVFVNDVIEFEESSMVGRAIKAAADLEQLASQPQHKWRMFPYIVQLLNAEKNKTLEEMNMKNQGFYVQ